MQNISNFCLWIIIAQPNYQWINQDLQHPLVAKLFEIIRKIYGNRKIEKQRNKIMDGQTDKVSYNAVRRRKI